MAKKKSAAFIALCEKYGVDPNKVPEITSFEDACKALGKDPTVLPIVDHLPESDQCRQLSDFKLSTIAHAIRGDKYSNYNNQNERKYFPVFEVRADKKRPSGFGLSCFVCVCWSSFSRVGVRLCFPERDMAVFFGQHFIELHKDHHLV